MANGKSAVKTRGRPAGKKKSSVRVVKDKSVGQKDARKIGRQAGAILLFAAALLLASIILIPGVNAWKFFHNLCFGIFGPCAFLWPVVLIYIAVMTAKDCFSSSTHVKLLEALGLAVLICSFLHIFMIGSFPRAGITELYQKGITLKSGGVAGGMLGAPLYLLFGKTGAAITVFLLIFVFTLLVTGVTLGSLFNWAAAPIRKLRQRTGQTEESDSEPAAIFFKHKKPKYNIDVDLGPENQAEPEEVPESEKPAQTVETEKDKPPAALDDLVKKISNFNQEEAPKIREEIPAMETPDGQQVLYTYPPVTLLKQETRPITQDVSEELKSNAARLVDTLKSFGVETRITDICRGPAVTRYELQPSAGVKISRITSLADDIALNLAAAGVRIEAPIPNKPAVGIEVPNKAVSIVHIREIVDSKEFRDARSRLTFALGRDIAGNVAVADIAKMPHMLIAGATGSGKSVCINSIIISLLYKGTPDEVKFLMVDPKVVELGIYNGIPHLLVPVVTDPRKAAGALNWAVTEMLNRYKLFADNNVRDMKGFNALAVKTEGLTPMPHIVIIIDELADLMMAAPNDVEDAICRLAQMARAAGMHLVIATQRPSVDVITGVIKANIPSRIAFAVSSQVDSRTIL
ncbi:MAG TPA: DNA translocase FtsK 4TM domain-containing protein, partial [Clostridia bacterium]|nr:DNA translocase FtsK 4TM domain-containing protein [Clostridia bacterium]